MPFQVVNFIGIHVDARLFVFMCSSSIIIFFSASSRHCIQCGIFSMSNMLRSADMRDIFLQEGLMDYLVCLPWLYPQDWPERRQAQQLVAFMGQHVQLQPPSLSNITKAKLAAMYFGLEKVLLADVNQLLTEAYA